ncbi:MAG: DUF1501 domain-containing protein, partial [Planctomycetes bacterium]|nr:DUF1501 domain-containing protein [Planctomycetota bacterium]
GGPISGAKNWSSGYMPATYQATVMRSQGTPILDLKPPAGVTTQMQREMLDALREYNNEHQTRRVDNSNLAARIASYELAYRMQAAAPEAVDLSQETEATNKLYGLDDKKTAVFGRQCLLTRRLVERGVRFVQLYSGGNHNDANWDAHGDLKRNHDLHAGETDKPIAGLLKDLKQRGLLDSTLVVFGTEFGRTPGAQPSGGTTPPGRDHHPQGFSCWLAGGGIKGGVTHGATDELGFYGIEDPHYVADIHATVLHQLGLDSHELEVPGRKRIDIHRGRPIKEIIA